MSMTITATFSAANASELKELIDLVLDNEPMSLSIEGQLVFDWTDTPISDIVDDRYRCVYCDAVFMTDEAMSAHYHDAHPNGDAIEGIDDQTPAEGIKRPTEREILTAELYKLMLNTAYGYQTRDDYRFSMRTHANNVWGGLEFAPRFTSMTYRAMGDLAHNIDTRDEFVAVIDSLSADAWGDRTQGHTL